MAKIKIFTSWWSPWLLWSLCFCLIGISCGITVGGGGGNGVNGGAIPQTAQSPAPGSVLVDIPVGASGRGPSAFGVNPLVISKGTTVVWINRDSNIHTVTSETAVFDSGNLFLGDSFTFTFNNSGSFPYHSSIDGSASMSGAVLVQ